MKTAPPKHTDVSGYTPTRGVHIWTSASSTTQSSATPRIAEAIAQGARTAAANADHVTLHHISDVQPEQVLAADLLVIGSPTQGFRPITPVRTLLSKLPRTGLAGKAVAAFDTRFTEEEIKSIGRMLSTMVDLFGYAAPQLARRPSKRRTCPMPPRGLLRRRQGRPRCLRVNFACRAWKRPLLGQ
ncbi:MAG: hypothetical protein R2854_15570 [Caldilineaceae bacterium]